MISPVSTAISLVLFFACFLSLTTGCIKYRNTYEIDQVRFYDVVYGKGTVYLFFSTLEESMFHCPGIEVEYSPSGACVSFVRAFIRDGGGDKGDLKAVPLRDFMYASDGVNKNIAGAVSDEVLQDGPVRVVTFKCPRCRYLCIESSGKKSLIRRFKPELTH